MKEIEDGDEGKEEPQEWPTILSPLQQIEGRKGSKRKPRRA